MCQVQPSKMPEASQEQKFGDSNEIIKGDEDNALEVGNTSSNTDSTDIICSLIMDSDSEESNEEEGLQQSEGVVKATNSLFSGKDDKKEIVDQAKEDKLRDQFFKVSCFCSQSTNSSLTFACFVLSVHA